MDIDILEFRIGVFDRLKAYKIGQELEGQATLSKFVDDLIQECNNDPQHTNSMKTVLLYTLNDDITTRLIQLLSDMELVALDNLLRRKASASQIAQFLREKISNLKHELSEVHSKLRTVYLYRPS